MSGFTPKEYEATGALKMLHNAPRFHGSNQIAITELLDGTVPNYVIGLASASMAFIVVFIFWTISLCLFWQCGKRVPLPNKINLVLFLFFLGVSISCFLISLKGNNAMVHGLDVIIANVETVLQEIKDTITNVDAFIDFLTDFGTISQDAADSCSATLNMTNQSFPLGNTTSFANEANNAIDPIKENLDPITTQVSDILKLVKENNSSVKSGYLALVIGLVVWLGLFGLISALRVIKKSNALAMIGKIDAVCFYTLGIIFLLILWTVIITLSLVSTFGADFCVPGPSLTLERVLEDITGDNCSVEPYTYICYYQTCSGVNPLESNLLDVNDLTGNITDIIQNVTQEVNNTLNMFNLTDTTCQSNLTKVNNEIGKLDGIVEETTSIIECDTINPIYTGIVYDGICNGIFHGMAIIWITFSTASLALMMAMLIYCIFDFKDGGVSPVSILPDKA